MSNYHQNYRHLIWTIALTDFKLRYHGSILGYIWALLKPLIRFAILFVVFTTLFGGRGGEYYALELFTGLMLFNYFTEGTNQGMKSLLSKGQMVSKIDIPMWVIIVASTLTATMAFLVNSFILAIFFGAKLFLPSIGGIAMFFLAVVFLYIIILSFSLITAPIFVKFRDLGMGWEVFLQALFYASPILYPLSMMPEWVHQYILLSPVAFVIHFTKQALLENHFATATQYAIFIGALAIVFLIGLVVYRKNAKFIPEHI
jgi:ABC-type polysaccharide/polyol phosphate export permease